MKRDSEVQRNDVPRDAYPAWDDHSKRPEEATKGIEKANTESSAHTEAADGLAAGKDARAEDIREAIIEHEAREVVEYASYTSTPIPLAADLQAYPKDVQDKIIHWHDEEVQAVYTDESKRQDRLVEAIAKGYTRDQYLSTALNAIIVIGAFVAFGITGNAAVFWSFALPGASVIGNIFINIKNSHSEPKKHDDDGGE